MPRHLFDIDDLDAACLARLLDDAARRKRDLKAGRHEQPLKGKVVALVFEKPSLRTRVSFETGIAHLGGTALFLPGQEIGLGWRESLSDFARTMSGYVNALVMRVFKHETLTGVAAASTLPVVNALSERAHPCQALADLLTVQELFGPLKGRTITFVGDGNNVARSLAFGCALAGVRFILSAPAGYGFDETSLREIRSLSPAATIEEITDPKLAVRAADVIYTDVWASMGQEDERDQRLREFAPYQVNEALFAAAPKHAKLLHCLPAHRGEEVSAGVIDGERSAVFQQAENRLHAQKAVLAWLFS